MTPSRPITPRLSTTHVVITIAALVSAIAVTGLLGWTFDNDRLKSLFYPGRVSMNPVTSVLFILASFALWLLRDPSAPLRMRRLAATFAVVVAFTAIARLGEYLALWNVGVDRLLFTSKLNGNVIAPNTAAAFVLMGLAILVIDAPKIGRIYPTTVLVGLAALLGLFSVIGHLYGRMELYGVRGFLPMAPNTALAFLLLVVGVLFARPEREPVATALSDTLGGIVARRLLPASFLVPMLVGWILLVGERHQLYDSTFGKALLVLFTVLIFNLLIWASARTMHKVDLSHRRMEDEMRLSQQRYRAIMQQAAEGIYLVDLHTKRIIESNGALERLMGYAPGEAEGKYVYELVDDAPAAVNDRLKRLETMGPTDQVLQSERRYRRKDGTVVDVFSSAGIIAYGNLRVACTVVHDITARKRAERELHEKNKQLEESVAAERAATEQLRQAQSQLVQSEKLAGLGQMVAGVAHEINNPLSFVSNNVAVLQRDVRGLCELLALYAKADPLIAERDAELLASIRDLSERMDLAYTTTNMTEMMTRSRDGLRRIQQIVKDLRDFARLDESDLQEADLNAGIESTVNIIRGRAKKKRVQIDLQLGHLPHVACYPAKINQVVMNLVANAIDACPEAGKVTVVSVVVPSGVRITVSDTGTGVPPAIRGRIFDPFFTTKPQGEGTGLGLSISYGIVNDHGGNIEVTDVPGGGAMFVVTLPVVKLDKKRAK